MDGKPAMTRGLQQVGLLLFMLIAGLLVGCEAAVQQVIPTDPPTITPTYTPSPTATVDTDATPTERPTRVALAPGEPTATPLFGATRTPLPEGFPTATRIFDPNAPRIDFFTSDPFAIQPGEIVTLYWSTRNTNNAVIYRLEADDTRAEVYNVAADGSLPIDTSINDRGALRFLLAVGVGSDYTDEIITIPLECPVEWFFFPPPDACANQAPIPSRVIDQTMERGRLVFVQDTNTVYALFNDGQQPAWTTFDNNYDPTIHPLRDENAPPEWIQPLAELGFVWRSDSDVRSRLGLGLSEGVELNGFIQTAPGGRNQEELYISGAEGVVLQIMPGSEQWRIIGEPR